jgi:hypothetical protein
MAFSHERFSLTAYNCLIILLIASVIESFKQEEEYSSLLLTKEYFYIQESFLFYVEKSDFGLLVAQVNNIDKSFEIKANIIEYLDMMIKRAEYELFKSGLNLDEIVFQKPNFLTTHKLLDLIKPFVYSNQMAKFEEMFFYHLRKKIEKQMQKSRRRRRFKKHF